MARDEGWRGGDGSRRGNVLRTGEGSRRVETRARGECDGSRRGKCSRRRETKARGEGSGKAKAQCVARAPGEVKTRYDAGARGDARASGEARARGKATEPRRGVDGWRVLGERRVEAMARGEPRCGAERGGEGSTRDRWFQATQVL
jgi:hypothetical protein